MSFDSVIFISCFLPVLAILYAIARGKAARNVLLLAAGLIFYAFGSVSGLLLLLACAAVNYLFGVWLIRTKDGGKGIAAAAVVLDLAFLAAFKYLDFALSALAPVLGGRQISVGLAAPVGISFFTFKCISYIVDTCRDRRSGTRSFFELLLYISFFPQIMAGPITRFTAFRGQLDARTCSTERAAAGLRRFVVGLGKKLILAGAAANVADRAFGPTAVPDARVAWLCAAAYMLQIYFDFSGYSDMAIGLGEICIPRHRSRNSGDAGTSPFLCGSGTICTSRSAATAKAASGRLSTNSSCSLCADCGTARAGISSCGAHGTACFPPRRSCSA